MRFFIEMVVLLLVFSSGALGQAPGILGDYDFDQQLTVADVNILSRAIAWGDEWFDLNEDESVDFDDHVYWVEELKGTCFGDASLDGVFDADDLVLVFQAGQYEDGVPQNSTWRTGDWSGDLEFDSDDMVQAFARSEGCFGLGPQNVAAGDFTVDQQLTAEDIDLLALIRQRGMSMFDLTDDGIVDTSDLDVWVKDLKGTWIGDANLDFVADSGDLVLVFQAGTYERDTLAGWSEGDWDANLRFNSADFVAAISEGCAFTICSGPRPIPRVPEPATGILFSTGLLVLVCCDIRLRR